jgi:hypothetical protein
VKFEIKSNIVMFVSCLVRVTKKVPNAVSYKQQSIYYLCNFHVWRLVVGSCVEAILMFRYTMQ